MAFLAQLWMPIVLSAVLVFVTSSVIHMVIKWHQSDYRKFANEDDVRAVIRAGNAAPGQYIVPHILDTKTMSTPEVQKKFTDGPVAFMTLRPPGPPAIGGALGQWFAFSLVVALLAAYIASKTLMQIEGTTFLGVCRVVGTITFLAYGGGSVTAGIWMGKPWGSVMKELLDAAIYALVSALAFGALWPH